MKKLPALTSVRSNSPSSHSPTTELRNKSVTSVELNDASLQYTTTAEKGVPAEVAFEQSEFQRKTQLVQLLSRIMLLLQVFGIVFYLLFWLILGQLVYLIGSGLSLMLGLSLLLSFRLATQSRYQPAAWLVVTSSLALVLFICWVDDTHLPVLVVFMLPLALAITLLNVTEVIGVAFFIMLATTGWYFNYHWLYWFSAATPQTEFIQVSGNLLVIAIIIPTLAALLVLPARSQVRAMRSQNHALEMALSRLAERQRTGQVVSQQVLEMASQLSATATQQASGSQEQAAVVCQVDSSMSELSATASSIAELAGQVKAAVNQAATDSRQIEETTVVALNCSTKGLAAVEQTVVFSQRTASLYQQLLTTLNDLNQKNSRMRIILDLLGSIASETHLLSLNAAIEAAGAGEYGDRFSVVAQEVKRLAARSASAGREVVTIVEEIETATRLAVGCAESGYAETHQLQEVAHETGHLIAQMQTITRQSHAQATSINSSTGSVKELSEIIWSATAQQRSASEQVLYSLKGLNEVAEQSAYGSSQISLTAEELQDLSQHLNVALLVA